jgi:predicted TIM-barrel fold metal-dependent hydrolase
VAIPILDIHTHIGSLPGVVGDSYTADDLAYVTEQEGVSYALASSASTTTIGLQTGMAESLDMVERHGDRLGALIWINPHDPTWMDETPRADQAGFKGIKLHPVLDHYQVDRAALDDVFACAQHHGWPILTHADADGTPMSAARYEPLIEAYPDVILILAHLRLEAIPLAKRFDNVFVDTTYVAPMRVELGVDALGPSKILFGTDACEGFDVGHEPGRVRPRRSYESIITSYRERGIADRDLEQILSLNAKSVFDIA